MYNKRFVASVNGICYIYVPSLGYWWWLRSGPALRQLCDTLEMDNVSVNFEKAAGPYISFLERQLISGYTVRYMRVSNILPHNRGDEVTGTNILPHNRGDEVTGADDAYKIVSGFCHMPLSAIHVPFIIVAIEPSKAEVQLLNVLRANNLDVIMLCISNALMDPVDRPRILVLFGYGGQGKTKAVEILLLNLHGVVYVLPKDIIASCKERFSEDDVENIFNNRYVASLTVTIRTKEVNEAALKLLTGRDKVYSVRTICGKNNALKLTPPDLNFSNDHIMKFASRCISVQSSMPDPPITVQNGIAITVWCSCPCSNEGHSIQ
ncbi:hypothetical protein BJ742DRAFT_739829 [Cladochytrium replicatum]|nr:hypothetical protein BJ742DRAFT_739829 [Cladochytrium replicatum]